MYRSLIAVEPMAATGTLPALRYDAPFSDLSPLPAHTSTRMDQVFARVAMDYHKWWEIADVLIDLADGEDGDASFEKDIALTKSQHEYLKIGERPHKTGHTVLAAASQHASPHLLTPGTKASDEGVDVSSPIVRPSSPTVTHDGSPRLIRAASMASFSPRASQNSHGGREIVSLDGHPTSINERQLEILRGMLKPSIPASASPTKSAKSARVSQQMASGTPAHKAPISLLTLQMDDSGTPSPPQPPFARKLVPVSAWSAYSSSASSSVSAIPRQVGGLFDTEEQDQTASNGSSPTPRAVSEQKPKGRLRQASRAGLLGIREFLKTLRRSSGPSSSSREGTPLEDETLLPTDAAPAVQGQSRAADYGKLGTPSSHARPHGLTPDRQIFSDSQIPRSTSSVGELRTPIKQPILAASLAFHDSIRDRGSPPVRLERQGKQLAMATDGSPASVGTGSSSEEDWDRDLEEASRSAASSPLSAGRAIALSAGDSPARGGSEVVRSDTQATLLARARPVNSKAAHRHSNVEAGPSNPANPARTSEMTAPSGIRPRTYSTNSTTTLTLAMASPGHLPAGSRLVMTTEAMPTLLRKIEEVKVYCNNCVTELRWVLPTRCVSSQGDPP